MPNTNNKINPFIYSTPDQIKNPEDALNLFVDVFKDFYLIESIGNTFVHGPRGSGKSMMFRIMKPDCQKLRLNKSLHELNYYSVYVPVKDTSLNIAELEFLNGKHGEHVLNEHLMVTYFSISVLKCLADEDYSDYVGELESCRLFYKNFAALLKNAGWGQDIEALSEQDSINGIFRKSVEALEVLLTDFSLYIQRLPLGPESYSYSGALCLYRSFFLPLIKEVSRFKFLPDQAIYVMVDDADLLSLVQTRILNSWVSYRSTSIVCFKITTQLTYKTYYTTNSTNKIDSPHDYHEINLSDIYTSNPKERYKDNVKQIVEKRLRLIAQIDNVSAEEFFPLDESQEKDRLALFKKIEAEKGYDYAYRNARVDYMLSLSNEYTYSYAGFEQLVHLSSGIIRNFIDLAFKMCDRAVRAEGTDGEQVREIPVKIQNEEIGTYSNWMLLQLDKSIDDKRLLPIHISNYKLLKALITSLGKAFRLFLESDTSERRKFSFYFDGEAPDEIREVLKLGVSEGFLHYSTHGSKTGLGRSHKYVFNRMLSPVFKLDAFSFSGYLYLAQDKLELAIKNERKFLAYIRERIKKDDGDFEKQLALDF